MPRGILLVHPYGFAFMINNTTSLTNRSSVGTRSGTPLHYICMGKMTRSDLPKRYRRTEEDEEDLEEEVDEENSE